jgi:hypothetical protein
VPTCEPCTPGAVGLPRVTLRLVEKLTFRCLGTLGATWCPVAEPGILRSRSLLVIAYPTMDARHSAGIPDVRQQHPELHWSVVTPQFTLVFPFQGEAPAALRNHGLPRRAGAPSCTKVRTKPRRGLLEVSLMARDLGAIAV